MCANTKKTWIIEYKKGNKKGKIEVPEGIEVASEKADEKRMLGYKIILRPKKEEDYYGY